jgi:hypothetical protein
MIKATVPPVNETKKVDGLMVFFHFSSASRYPSLIDPKSGWPFTPSWLHGVRHGSINIRMPDKAKIHQVRRAKTNQRDSKLDSSYEPEGREFDSLRPLTHVPFVL